VQLDPAASDAVQVPVANAKSVGFVPPTEVGSVSVMADDVLFVSVTNCAADVAPTSCVPKLMLVAETEMVGVRGSSLTNALDTPFSVVWKAPVVTGNGFVPVEGDTA
jgi:hypothetical protein